MFVKKLGRWSSKENSLLVRTYLLRHATVLTKPSASLPGGLIDILLLLLADSTGTLCQNPKIPWLLICSMTAAVLLGSSDKPHAELGCAASGACEAKLPSADMTHEPLPCCMPLWLLTARTQSGEVEWSTCASQWTYMQCWGVVQCAEALPLLCKHTPQGLGCFAGL